MHLNYHFFRFLCPSLQGRILGRLVSACFSQNKDELVIEFSGDESNFSMVAHLIPAATCLYFPSDFKRSKRNNVNLFPKIVGQEVSGVKLFAFERAFAVCFKTGDQLIFKMHGSRSNILFVEAGCYLPTTIFRHSLKEDSELDYRSLDRLLDLSAERFAKLEGHAGQFLPTLGKVPRAWLKDAGYLEMYLEERYRLMQQLLDLLDVPLFSIQRSNDGYVLTMLPSDSAEYTTADPVDACNAYFRKAIIQEGFEREKRHHLKLLNEQLLRTEQYLAKTYSKLDELESETSPAQLADIIMANLHQIPRGSERVELFDFYNDITIEVKLKREISPQKHAENLYRKAKNRKIELAQLEKNLEEKEALLVALKAEVEELGQIGNYRELKVYKKEKGLFSQPQRGQDPVPYKRFEVEGFEVLVGKSAKANDELLRRYAWKEDLWLHAKDVTGSHVLVKSRSGTTFPKTVVERAAELAAYYSKSRTDSLSPVIYTPAKYVRKVKGSAPGAVAVDREKVLMVRPRGPEGENEKGSS